MSTSHYSNGNYKPIKSSDPNPALSQMRKAVYAWQDDYTHPSIQHSRPECTDVGANTITLKDNVLAPMPNTRRSPLPRLLTLLAGGVALLLLDGFAIAHYADSVVDAVIIALVTMPTGGFILATALAIADVSGEDTDWMQ